MIVFAHECPQEQQHKLLSLLQPLRMKLPQQVEIITFHVCILNTKTNNLYFYLIGKEERTPSDSQSTTNERPMVEVKKQKTQK
jgi:hypothetical protein